MLPVLYPRFRRRTLHRRPANRRLVDSRENDAFHPPCFVLGLFYTRDVEQLKSCLSLSLARARDDIASFVLKLIVLLLSSVFGNDFYQNS